VRTLGGEAELLADDHHFASAMDEWR